MNTQGRSGGRQRAVPTNPCIRQIVDLGDVGPNRVKLPAHAEGGGADKELSGRRAPPGGHGNVLGIPDTERDIVQAMDILAACYGRGQAL